MIAAIQRHSFFSSIVGSFLLLVLAGFTLSPDGRSLRHSATKHPSARFDLRIPEFSGGILHRQKISPSPVIDPVLVYSTFLGGAGIAQGGTPVPPSHGSASQYQAVYQGATGTYVDPSGNLFLVGTTSADDFPVTSGVPQPVNSNNDFVGFLSKIDPSGHLVFSTYLDGMSIAAAIAIDANSGDIYVAGISPSPSQTPLPVPAGTTPFDSAPKPISIVRLNSMGTTILNATYLGGSSVDLVSGIALDSSSNVYLAGSTTSNDFPTMNALQASLGASGQNVFVTKLNPTLGSLIYSTYLGGDSYTLGAGTQTPTATSGHGIAVDSSGDAYVVGMAITGFPGTTGSTCDNGCPFLAQLNPAGTSILRSTFLAGVTTGGSFVNAVAVDASKNVFLAGGGATPTFTELNSVEPCPAPATLAGQRVDSSGFISEVNAAGTLVFSTCFGETENFVGLPDWGVNDLVLDSSGNVYVVGFGDPTLVNPIQSSKSQGALYVAAINPHTPSLLFSSYLAGVQSGIPPNGAATGVGVDSNGNIYAAGVIYNSFNTTLTSQPPLPVFNALQPVAGLVTSIPLPFACVQSPNACKVSDAFALKIAPTDAAAAALYPALVTFPVQSVGTPSDPLAVNIIDMGSASLTVSNAAATGPFSLQNNCATVAGAGGTCTIQVTFTPTTAGTQTGVLTITDSSPGSPRTVQLTGQGGQGSAAVSPTSLSFTNQQLGVTSSPQTVTLTNTGALTLEISHIQTSSPFDETNNCGTSLAANASCTISVTFTPTVNGAATGTVTITDSAPDTPQTIALTGTGGSGSSGGGSGGGTGVGPPSIGLGVPSGGSASATVAAGASVTYALSIGGAGVGGTASLTCGGAPTGATCSVPATVSLNASTASTFNATVTTSARSNLWFYPSGPAPWLGALAVLFCLALLQTAAATRFPRLRCRFAPILAVALCACGGGNLSAPLSIGGTPAGSYTVTITAKTGTTTQTQNLTLVVH